MDVSRAYPRAAAFMLGALALAAVVAAATGASSPPDPAPLTLRLGDLPHGWKLGNDSGCGTLGTEDAPPEVRDLVVRRAPRECRRDFIQLWGERRNHLALRPNG